MVGCFDNAEDAIDTLEKSSCDMILMDINIKVTTGGIQLAREILNIYTLPIVFITAYNDEATLEEVLGLSPFHSYSKKGYYLTSI